VVIVGLVVFDDNFDEIGELGRIAVDSFAQKRRAEIFVSDPTSGVEPRGRLVRLGGDGHFQIFRAIGAAKTDVVFNHADVVVIAVGTFDGCRKTSI